MSYSTVKFNKQYTVCANHFEDNQFMNPAMKNRLIHNAVPTILIYQIHHQNSHLNPNFQSTKAPSSTQEGIIYMSFVLTRLFKTAEEYCEFLSGKHEESVLLEKGVW